MKFIKDDTHVFLIGMERCLYCNRTRFYLDVFGYPCVREDKVK